eukprot:scaffold84460_cov15-Tisochrysis_lutea.AAC.3
MRLGVCLFGSFYLCLPVGEPNARFQVGKAEAGRDLKASSMLAISTLSRASNSFIGAAGPAGQEDTWGHMRHSAGAPVYSGATQLAELPLQHAPCSVCGLLAACSQGGVVEDGVRWKDGGYSLSQQALCKAFEARPQMSCKHSLHASRCIFSHDDDPSRWLA